MRVRAVVRTCITRVTSAITMTCAVFRMTLRLRETDSSSQRASDDDELLVQAPAVLKSQGRRKLVPWETRSPLGRVKTRALSETHHLSGNPSWAAPPALASAAFSSSDRDIASEITWTSPQSNVAVRGVQAPEMRRGRSGSSRLAAGGARALLYKTARQKAKEAHELNIARKRKALGLLRNHPVSRRESGE